MITAPDREAARIVATLRATDGPIQGEVALVQRLGNADAWLLRGSSRLLVLKRGRPEQDEADVTWEHDHLRALQSTGFRAPVPIPVFDGQSWAKVDGRIWATLTYLPGRPLASEPDPDMEAAGSFLARYHHASGQISTDQQRPTSSGLGRLREVTPWDELRAALGSDDALAQFSHLLEDLEAGLHELQPVTIEHLVIHGDATNDNLIVDGSPPKVIGLIDFGASSLAPWPADLAAALWRSGRRVDSDVALEFNRVTRFVRGYHRDSPMPPRLARAIPLLIQARGLGLVSRRVRRLALGVPPYAIPDTALALTRAVWVHDHRQDLIAAIDAALADDQRLTPGAADG